MLMQVMFLILPYVLRPTKLSILVVGLVEALPFGRIDNTLAILCVDSKYSTQVLPSLASKKSRATASNGALISLQNSWIVLRHLLNINFPSCIVIHVLSFGSVKDVVSTFQEL